MMQSRSSFFQIGHKVASRFSGWLPGVAGIGVRALSRGGNDAKSQFVFQIGHKGASRFSGWLPGVAGIGGARAFSG